MVIDVLRRRGRPRRSAFCAMMASTGRLHARDVSERRLDNLGFRASRAQRRQQCFCNDHAHRERATASGSTNSSAKADRVLVDAPCSGLGTLQAQPRPEVAAIPSERRSWSRSRRASSPPRRAWCGRAGLCLRRLAACSRKKTRRSPRVSSKQTPAGFIAPSSLHAAKRRASHVLRNCYRIAMAVMALCGGVFERTA